MHDPIVEDTSVHKVLHLGYVDSCSESVLTGTYKVTAGCMGVSHNLPELLCLGNKNK